MSRLLETLYQFPVPVLLTVRGDVNAVAVGIASCCDMVLASEKPRSALPSRYSARYLPSAAPT